jgi:hypothetical protein
MLACVTMSACSAPGNGDEARVNDIGGSAGQLATGAGRGGAPSSSGGSLAVGGLGTSGSGGAGGLAGSANDTAGAAAGQAGIGGVPTAGAHAGGAGAGGGAFAGGPAGGSGGTNAAVCQMVKAEYATELEKQLACTPGAGSQCTNKVAAAPGCECRVFIQPADPFAIEHLSNVGDGWYRADCNIAICPAKCSAAAAGTCQADTKSPLGGRCVTP